MNLIAMKSVRSVQYAIMTSGISNATINSILTETMSFVFAMPAGMIVTEIGKTDVNRKNRAMPELALKNARIVTIARKAKNARICAQTATNAEIPICQHTYAMVLNNPSPARLNTYVTA
jgi:hypothetical protein